MKRSAFVKALYPCLLNFNIGYNLLAARMRILASLSVSRMEKKVFRLRSCFCRVSFPGERKLLLLQCFSTVISLFTWLKKNWSCSLAKLMQACSKLFFSKCSKPNISRIPTGCKKKKDMGNSLETVKLWKTAIILAVEHILCQNMFRRQFSSQSL